VSKRTSYLSLAEKMYVIEHKSIERIALDLNLNFKTILRWKDEGGWEEKRESYVQNQQMFHEELYIFSRKLMRSIQEDLDNDRKTEAGRMYTFTRMLPLITKIKEYEDIVAKKQDDKDNKTLTDEDIREIEDLLGIRKHRKDESDEL